MVYTLPADSGRNFSAGLDQIFKYISDQVPLFFPLILVSFFLIIFFGGMIRAKKDTGTEKASEWFAIAGISTFFLASILFLTAGLLNLQTFIITLIIAIFGGLWYLTSNT